MRILMYGWEFPPANSGGLGVACYGLSRGLVQEGAEVTFVLPRRCPVAQNGAKVVFADTVRDVLTDEQTRLLLSGYATTKEQTDFLERSRTRGATYGASLFDEVLRYAAHSTDVALREGADIIHAHDWLSYPAGMAAQKALGVPFIAHVHATEFDRTGFGIPDQRVYEIERAGMHAADMVVAVSAYTKRIVVEKYGVDPQKVMVLHNGIDADDTAVASAAESDMKRLKAAGWGVVLFVGRLTIQKGPDYFLAAAKKVLEHRPKTLFVVSGSGDMARQMIDTSAYHGLGDKVLYTGFLRGKELARLYKTADLVVMPSVSEPFGIVPLEALLNGAPVLISKQSGVAEVVPNALKADFWDVDDMAHKIISVLDYPALKDTLLSNGARDAQRQVWRKVARHCMMIYERVKSMLVPTHV
jgi:glycosyltransferase involved in cell wall biosynthesis